jgi:hypothetical protein
LTMIESASFVGRKAVWPPHQKPWLHFHHFWKRFKRTKNILYLSSTAMLLPY